MNELILEITQMTPFELLTHQRFDPVGSKYHVGEVGEYFQKRLREVRSNMSNDEWVELSKKVGWQNG